eukprot:gene17928-biopygen18921
MDGWMGGWMDGWMDGWMQKCPPLHARRKVRRRLPCQQLQCTHCIPAMQSTRWWLRHTTLIGRQALR